MKTLIRWLPAALLTGSAASALAQPVEPTPPADPADPVAAEEAEGVDPSAPPAAPPETPSPEEAEAAPVDEVKSGYDKGFFISHDGEKGTFKLKITARVQSGFEGRSRVDDADERTNTGAFLVRRARLTLEGHAFTEKLAYKFQTDFGRGFVTLKDFIIDGEIAPEVWVRTGQWKRPFSRQQITSSGRLELVDRATTDRAFRGGRDLGVAVHNGYEDSPALEWIVGVFNGTGETPVFSGGEVVDGEVEGGSFSNVPGDFLPVFIGRVGANSEGMKGYSEADFEGGPLRWGAAASVWLGGDADGGAARSHQAQADVIIKNNGLSATAAFYAQTADTDLSLLGGHVQAGLVFGEDTRRMNGVARYAILMPQGDGAADPSHEVTIGVGWFPHAHNAKLQAEIGSIIEPDAGAADNLIGRVQAQLAF